MAFAREGASVVGCDATVEPAESTVEVVRGVGGDMVSMQPCRLDDPADCQALVELALATYGQIDVLCNIAATAYFNWRHEICLFGWKAGHRPDWVDMDLAAHTTSVWEMTYDGGAKKQQTDHPTQKPVEVIRRARSWTKRPLPRARIFPARLAIWPT